MELFILIQNILLQVLESAFFDSDTLIKVFDPFDLIGKTPLVLGGST